VIFLDSETEAIYHGVDNQKTRNLLPKELHEKAARLLDRLDAAHDLRDLSAPGLRLEKLGGKRAGQYSVRINEQYRICFTWQHGEPINVEITDYH
jgi:proteic killer suppression protein